MNIFFCPYILKMSNEFSRISLEMSSIVAFKTTLLAEVNVPWAARMYLLGHGN